MKKLSVNINDIHIRGSLTQLSEVITSIDEVMQSVSQETEAITSSVIRYSASNSGQQYAKMVNSLMVLRDFLYESSLQLNEMQNEIVEYQNKIMRYEDVIGSAIQPKKYIVQRTQIDSITTDMKFRVSEMIQLSMGLQQYSANVYYKIQDMVRSKNEAARFWCDSQYNDFAEFIDEISTQTINCLKTFGEYVSYLEDRIKELS